MKNLFGISDIFRFFLSGFVISLERNWVMRDFRVFNLVMVNRERKWRFIVGGGVGFGLFESYVEFVFFWFIDEWNKEVCV